MTNRYGNIGLAAVGYNGGERRAEGLIDGTGDLAQETVDYVRIITGTDHQTWVSEPPKVLDLGLDQSKNFVPPVKLWHKSVVYHPRLGQNQP